MAWILFKAEIAHIWADDGKSLWKPGKPMYRRPRGHFFNQQVIRPMMDILDNNRDEYVIHLGNSFWCPECDVGWDATKWEYSSSFCWSCGQGVLRIAFDYSWTAAFIPPRPGPAISAYQSLGEEIANATQRAIERVTASMDRVTIHMSYYASVIDVEEITQEPEIPVPDEPAIPERRRFRDTREMPAWARFNEILTERRRSR